MKVLIICEEDYKGWYVGRWQSLDLSDPACRDASPIPGAGYSRYPVQKYAHVFEIDSNAREVQKHLKGLGVETELIEWYDLVNSQRIHNQSRP
jgi:hypothetical protein